jgi:hypothetical protein
MNEGRIPMGAQYLVRNSTKSPMKIRMWIVSRGRGRMLHSVYFLSDFEEICRKRNPEMDDLKKAGP